MLRRYIKVLGRARLDDLSQVHDRHPIAHVLHHRQVMGDEEVREAELLLEILEQVDHLRLDRQGQGGHRFVTNDEVGLDIQRTRDSDPLSLASTELVRVEVGVLGSQSDDLQQLTDPPRAGRSGLGKAVDLEHLPEHGADSHTRVQ